MGVAIYRVSQLQRQARIPVLADLHGVYAVHIGAEQAGHGGEIGAGPIAGDVGLAGRDRAAREHPGERRGIVHEDLRLRLAGHTGLAEVIAVVAIVDAQAAHLDVGQNAQHKAPRQIAARTQTPRLGQQANPVDAGVVHDRTPDGRPVPGWGWTGTRFKNSFRACQ